MHEMNEPPDWDYWAVMIALVQLALDLITAVSS